MATNVTGNVNIVEETGCVRLMAFVLMGAARAIFIQNAMQNARSAVQEVV